MIYAYLYCISSEYTNKYGLKKLGCTLYPIHRMSTFNTGDAPGIGLEKNMTQSGEFLQNQKKNFYD